MFHHRFVTPICKIVAIFSFFFILLIQYLPWRFSFEIFTHIMLCLIKEVNWQLSNFLKKFDFFKNFDDS